MRAREALHRGTPSGRRSHLAADARPTGRRDSAARRRCASDGTRRQRAAWEAARAKLNEAHALLTALAREGKSNDSTTGVTRDVEALLASCERALASR